MAYDKAIEYIRTLCEIPSPTGYTKNIELFVLSFLSELGFSPRHLPKGTIVCDLGGKSNPLLLSSHLDTLGAMVKSVKDNGRINFLPIGGYDGRTIEDENCILHTRQDKSYTGTIKNLKASLHVYGSSDNIGPVLDNLEIVVDEVVSSKEETMALGISPGDFISFDPRTIYTDSGFIKSRHLDDKASAGILLALALMVAKKQIVLTRKVYIMFTVYEEVGHGASATFELPIKDMIAVDMGCVGDDLTCDETMVSICAKDSSGPYNYDLTNELINLAKKNKLNYALDIYPRYQSDASAALRGGLDARCALIGPGVYSSHGYERTHRLAIKNTLDLLLALIANKV